MRRLPCIIQEGSKCHHRCLYKRSKDSTYTQKRRKCEHRGRNWSDEAANQGMPTAIRHWMRQGISIPLQSLRGTKPCWPAFWISGSRTERECISVALSHSPWRLVTAAEGNLYGPPSKLIVGLLLLTGIILQHIADLSLSCSDTWTFINSIFTSGWRE